MGARKTKNRVLQLIESGSLEKNLRRLADFPVKNVINALFSAICRPDYVVHWQSVRAMGVFVARLAEKDMEEARVIMRRLLWSLNDESGGIGWGAPEAMAEIMVHHDGLAEEYIHMLISYMREDGEELFQDGNFLEHESLQRGLLWGVARLSETKPEMLRDREVVRDIVPYLASPDAGVRGLAARSLGFLAREETLPLIEPLLDDSSSITVFLDDAIQSMTVGRLAGEAMERIKNN